MGVGAHSVTSMVVEWYLRVENAKIKPKNNIKAKTKIFDAKLAQKGQKSAKMPNQNFQGQTPSEKVKFDLFGLTQGPNGNPDCLSLAIMNEEQSWNNRRQGEQNPVEYENGYIKIT